MSATKSEALVAALHQGHQAWKKETDDALAGVRCPEASVWQRWIAVRYLRDQFLPRLEQELHVLTNLADQVPPTHAGYVWALGELLQFLARHLCELGTTPQCGPAFADASTKLLRALNFWCAEVEAALLMAEAAGLTPAALDMFEPLIGSREAALAV